MLNKIDSTSFSGKVTITHFENANTYKSFIRNTSLIEDRLIKLTADSICKVKGQTQPVENKLAAPFAKLIKLITGNGLKNNEQQKVMTVFDKQIVFADKYPRLDGTSVVIDFDERIDL